MQPRHWGRGTRHSRSLSLFSLTSITSQEECKQYWDLRAQSPVVTVNLPERLYSLDVSQQHIVAACANRRILVYSVSDPSKPLKEFASPLKWQTKVVRCFTDGRPGFAIGSIEGRVGIQYIFLFFPESRIGTQVESEATWTAAKPTTFPSSATA